MSWFAMPVAVSNTSSVARTVPLPLPLPQPTQLGISARICIRPAVPLGGVKSTNVDWSAASVTDDDPIGWPSTLVKGLPLLLTNRRSIWAGAQTRPTAHLLVLTTLKRAVCWAVTPSMPKLKTALHDRVHAGIDLALTPLLKAQMVKMPSDTAIATARSFVVVLIFLIFLSFTCLCLLEVFVPLLITATNKTK